MAGGSRFRLPYKRRKYYHRSNRDTPLINTHVSSLVNPFDTKNGQPKWPDGLATYSIGRRHQLTTEVYRKNFYVVLFPGAINWCVAFTVNQNIDEDSPHCEVWANHTANISINYEFNMGAETDPPEGAPDNWDKSRVYELHVAHDAFSSWRNVATACHLQVINTTDTNDGWFRAVRVNRKRELTGWFDTIVGPGSAYGNGNHILETPHFHTGGVLPSTQMLEWVTECFEHEPSFCCGELQDIHNAVFQLNQIKEKNEFKQLRTETLFSNTEKKPIWKRDAILHSTTEEDGSLLEMWAVEQEHNVNSVNMAKPKSYTRSRAEFGLLSDSKDIVILQVLGGPNTKVLIHSVNNQEFLCPDNSQLAQYVTPCQYDVSGLRRYNDNRSNFHKFPYHYLADIGDTEKALPPVFYTSQPWHYYG